MVPTYILIGIAAGVLAGLFGVGGGVIIVPSLVYLAGFAQVKANGTSLAVLLLPVGLAAVLEYYRHGNMDIRAAGWIALGLLAGAWVGALMAHKVAAPWLKLSFGIFVILVGSWLVFDTLRRWS